MDVFEELLPVIELPAEDPEFRNLILDFVKGLHLLQIKDLCDTHRINRIRLYFANGLFLQLMRFEGIKEYNREAVIGEKGDQRL